MVLVKNWHFFHIIILGKRGQGNVFYDILERKNAFLDYKNNKLKKVERLGFPKVSIVLVKIWQLTYVIILGKK